MRNTRIPLMLNAGITQINIDDALGLRTRHSALLHIESALPLHYTTLMGDAVLCCSSRNTCRVCLSVGFLVGLERELDGVVVLESVVSVESEEWQPARRAAEARTTRLVAVKRRFIIA